MSAYDMTNDPGDPEIEDQRYVCISYAPHPDHNTIYFKIRGSYATVEEAQERAMFLHQLQLTKKANMASQGISYPLISIYVGEVGQFLSAQSQMIDFSEPNNNAPDIPINIISEYVDETVPTGTSDPNQHTGDEEPDININLNLSEPAGQVTNTDAGDACCLACQSAKRNALFLPCRHICFCINCTNMHIKKHKECPICRTSIKEILNVFIN